MENTHHKVTKEWLNSNKTAKGAWTRKQIVALGISWPPTSGWIQSITGQLITSEAARKFEEGKTQHAPIKGMKLKKIKTTLDTLDAGYLEDLKSHIEYLLKGIT